jgi:hypothetical protein
VLILVAGSSAEQTMVIACIGRADPTSRRNGCPRAAETRARERAGGIMPLHR